MFSLDLVKMPQSSFFCCCCSEQKATDWFGSSALKFLLRKDPRKMWVCRLAGDIPVLIMNITA